MLELVVGSDAQDNKRMKKFYSICFVSCGFWIYFWSFFTYYLLPHQQQRKTLHTLISWLLTPTYLLKCGHECLVEKMGKISLWCTNCIKRWKKSCFFVDLSWCNRRCTLRNCLVPGHYQHFAFNFRRVNNIRTAEIRLEGTVN